MAVNSWAVAGSGLARLQWSVLERAPRILYFEESALHSIKPPAGCDNL